MTAPAARTAEVVERVLAAHDGWSAGTGRVVCDCDADLRAVGAVADLGEIDDTHRAHVAAEVAAALTDPAAASEGTGDRDALRLAVASAMFRSHTGRDLVEEDAKMSEDPEGDGPYLVDVWGGWADAAIDALAGFPRPVTAGLTEAQEDAICACTATYRELNGHHADCPVSALAAAAPTPGQENEPAAALTALAAVRAVHARYFDLDGRPGYDDTTPEPEDVWRYDRDFRAALAEVAPGDEAVDRG